MTPADVEALLASPYAPELAAALVAVSRAARLTRAAQAGLTASDKAAKADASPVTVADYAAQALVSLSLSAACPAVALLAEEDASALRAQPALLSRVADLVRASLRAEPAAAQLAAVSDADVAAAVERGAGGGGAGCCWVLDPIDGTKGFVAQRQYTVALALLVDGKVVLGALACPNLGPSGVDVCASDQAVAFLALRGLGSFQLPLASLAGAREGEVAARLRKLAQAPPAHARRLRQPAPPAAAAALRVAESSGHSVCAAHGETAAVADELGVSAPPIQCDSCCKYGLCARGEAGYYLRFPPLGYAEKSWDHAAAAIVFEESGGLVTDCEGAALDFSTGRELRIAGGIVASPSAEVHQQLLAAVAKRVTRSRPPQ